CPNAIAITALNKNVKPNFHEKSWVNCCTFCSMPTPNIKINKDPISNMYPVNNRGSNVGFSTLINIKLIAWKNIDKKIYTSPTEIELTPSPHAIDVKINSTKPSKKPNARHLVTWSRKKITDNNIVTNGDAPKIMPVFTPDDFVKPIAKKV